MNLTIVIPFILLGTVLIFGGWRSYRKSTQPEKIDVRIPGATPRRIAPYATLPLGIIFFSFGIFSALHPINTVIAYIISIVGILFGLVLYFKRLFKATKP